ncbi:hypothetical protein MKW94_012252, partial [Papaver nudicaule]|nr:hypothetical protein [Papaver nudicaule]
LTGNKLLCFSDKDVCAPSEYIEGTGLGKIPGAPGIPGALGVPGTNEGNRKNSLQIILGTVVSMFVIFSVIV